MDLSIGLEQEKKRPITSSLVFRIVYLHKQLMQKTGKPVKNSIAFLYTNG